MGSRITPPVPTYSQLQPHFRTFQLIPHLGNYILFRYFHFIIDSQANVIFSDLKTIIYAVPVKTNFLRPFLRYFRFPFHHFVVLLRHFRARVHYRNVSNSTNPHQCGSRYLLNSDDKFRGGCNRIISRTVSLLVLLATGEGTPWDIMKKALISFNCCGCELDIIAILKITMNHIIIMMYMTFIRVSITDTRKGGGLFPSPKSHGLYSWIPVVMKRLSTWEVSQQQKHYLGRHFSAF